MALRIPQTVIVYTAPHGEAKAYDTVYSTIQSIEGDNVKMQVDETWWECVSPSCLYADEPASPTPTA